MKQQKFDAQKHQTPQSESQSSLNQSIFKQKEQLKGSSKIRDLLQLDRLLKKYSQELGEQQTPLAASIVKKFKKISKKKKLTDKYKKNEVSQPQKSQLKDFCYVCREKIIKAHQHYQTMCLPCGSFNFQKRNAKANLKGKIALVTGARIKIGFYSCLNLLRNGCFVIATTRFANDAVQRYMQEEDYNNWKDRLQIIQTSMNSLKSITQLSNYIKNKKKRLDFLINNAAQTIRRPKAFYSPLEKTKYDPDNLIKLVIDDYFEFNSDKMDLAIEYQDIKKFVNQNPNQLGKKQLLLIKQEDKQQDSLQMDLQVPQCDLMKKVSDTPLQAYDKQTVKHYYEKYFPKDVVDQHAQQIDLRPVNTWIRNLQSTHVLQLGQVLMINCVAPFTMIQQLCSIMKRQKNQDSTYIINVSSMEGCFNRRFKTQFHPHTNIAKAGLNMITRTCGQEFAKNNIIMVSVDTGWNTIQQPNSYEQKSPLDCIDGAARILDPIYKQLPKAGIFYKNYERCDW